MLKKEIIYRNPLINLGYENEDILPNGGFGAVIAHAGVGKTALLVQMALNTMIREKTVLHVSLHDAVSKVDVWYHELFQNIAANFNAAEIKDYWEKIQPYRFIMTFKVESFSVPKLEERLTDLMEQNIFKPHTVIIDGLKFDESGRGPLVHLKELAKKYSMRIWFTVHAHRHERPRGKWTCRFLFCMWPIYSMLLFNWRQKAMKFILKLSKENQPIPQKRFCFSIRRRC